MIKLIVSVGLLVTRGLVVDFPGTVVDFVGILWAYCSSVVVVPVEYVVEYVVDVVVSFKWFSKKFWKKINIQTWLKIPFPVVVEAVVL